MSGRNMNIGDAELEIMKVIWSAEEPISSAEIGNAVESRGWKRTTIATFLSRLTDKGAISAEKRGKTMYYKPVITAKEYRKLQIKNLIKNVFDGSSRDLIASLFEENTLSDDDIAELKSIFNDKE